MFSNNIFNDSDVSPSLSYLSNDNDNGAVGVCSKLLSKLDSAAMLRLRLHFTKFKSDHQINRAKFNINEGHFVNAVNTIFGNLHYNLDALKLFKILDFEDTGYIEWDQLLEYVIDYNKSTAGRYFTIKKSDIFIKDLEHCKKESISAILAVEDESTFCYIIISKHGKVGTYDGKLSLLQEYDVFFLRTGVTKRIRDIWITASVYLSDIKALVITASDKSMMVYDASTLCHVPMFLITGITNVPMCLSYNPPYAEFSKSHLVMGDDLGGLTTIVFKQPNIGMFYKKNPDKLTSYFWIELQGVVNEVYCKIKFKRRVHSRAVKKIVHVVKNNCIISCSSDCDASIVIHHNKGIMDSYTFKIQRGVSCFHYSEFLNLLVTGGTDRRLRLWEPVITIRPSAVFPIQSAKIIDVIFLAHLHAVLSFNKNGVLKLWNIFNQGCIQSINVQFPSFGILGRPIQFGFESIYCGPARASQKLEFDSSTKEPPEYKEYVKWSRPEIVVTCCNHIAILPMSNESILKSVVDIKREADSDDVEYALLPPPERNHCPRRPSLWKDQQLDAVKDVIIDEVEESAKEENAVEFDIKLNATPLEELLARNGLSGILEKDFLNEIGQKHNLSSKLIIHSSKQEMMRLPVSQGAPFTALDLQHHTDIVFSTRLPLSIRMQKKSGLEYFDNPQQILRHNSCFSMATPKSNYTALSGDEAEPQSDEKEIQHNIK